MDLKQYSDLNHMATGYFWMPFYHKNGILSVCNKFSTNFMQVLWQYRMVLYHVSYLLEKVILWTTQLCVREGCIDQTIWKRIIFLTQSLLFCTKNALVTFFQPTLHLYITMKTNKRTQISHIGLHCTLWTTWLQTPSFEKTCFYKLEQGQYIKGSFLGVVMTHFPT